jgi:PadR family transcriptional regulator PadR
MRGKHMRELKRGLLGSLLLNLLHAKPSYGYELCERLRAESDDVLSFEDGAIYPLLHTFVQQGLVEAFWEEENIDTLSSTLPARRGPRRRYYRLTPTGENALQTARSEWHTFSHAVARMLEATQTRLNSILGTPSFSIWTFSKSPQRSK